MKTLQVQDMHCPKCVERISHALQVAEIACTIDLATKTVCVEEAKVAQAIEELDDLGFDAVSFDTV